jgi:hypothetical protein
MTPTRSVSEECKLLSSLTLRVGVVAGWNVSLHPARVYHCDEEPAALRHAALYGLNCGRARYEVLGGPSLVRVMLVVPASLVRAT